VRSRLWNGLHKEYKESWKDNKDDYVPVAVALWFCCAAVAADDCCDDVLPVAASLLVACTKYGVDTSSKAKRDATFSIEVDSRYGVETNKEGRVKKDGAGMPILIDGTLPAQIWEAAMLLSTKCAAVLITQMGGDKLREKAHRQLGELGAKVIERSQERLRKRRAAERKRAGGSAAAAAEGQQRAQRQAHPSTYAHQGQGPACAPDQASASDRAGAQRSGAVRHHRHARSRVSAQASASKAIRACANLLDLVPRADGCCTWHRSLARPRA
jgi:hypothetical protein